MVRHLIYLPSMTTFFEETSKKYRPKQAGTIIFLNGASSCGKSTIAKLLQKELTQNHNDPFLYYALDDFAHILTSREPNVTVLSKLDTAEVWQQILYAFHLSIPKLAEAGNNIIVDHVFHGPFWSKHIVENLIDSKVFFVGIHCPLETLKEREKNRCNRETGLTDFHFKEAHRYSRYDFEVDSSEHTVDTSVEMIITAYKNRTPEEYTGIKETYKNILGAKQ